LTILDEWQITPQQLTQLLNGNPSLKGMLLGYVAELKLRELVTALPGVSYTVKFDDHNRKKKGDLSLIYRGRAFALESKSLQSATARWDQKHQRWTGKAQVDASDKRLVTFPDGSVLQTTLLLRGGFDILAVNCHAFEGQWRFAFARNSDLPASTWPHYSETQRSVLIASLVSVTWPPEPPFYASPGDLLDEMIAVGAGHDPSDLG
jgi:hypothetical protein